MARYARIDQDILRMALIGLESEKIKIETAIAEIQVQLGRRGSGRPKGADVTGPVEAAPRNRTLSAAARLKIAAAQRKRWAAIKKAKAEPEKPKRVLSTAARKRMADATRKRWATFRKAKAQATPKSKAGKPATKAQKAAPQQVSMATG
jgi:hypothetical protein